jgi:hypothetical protein
MPASVQRQTTGAKTPQEAIMKHFLATAIATCLLISDAQAEQTWSLHGLFCNTEAQARDALDLYSSSISLRAAVADVNKEAVNCVVADRIEYVVSQPLIIDTIARNGFTLTMYEANLVGVLIGGNTRPIAPPLRMYFVLDKRLAGVATLSGT